MRNTHPEATNKPDFLVDKDGHWDSIFSWSSSHLDACSAALHNPDASLDADFSSRALHNQVNALSSLPKANVFKNVLALERSECLSNLK
jgi:hypothetical protein